MTIPPGTQISEDDISVLRRMFRGEFLIADPGQPFKFGRGCRDCRNAHPVVDETPIDQGVVRRLATNRAIALSSSTVSGGIMDGYAVQLGALTAIGLSMIGFASVEDGRGHETPDGVSDGTDESWNDDTPTY